MSKRDEPGEGRDTWDGTGGGYRWTCPFCGASRLNSSDGERARENAIAALRTHIVASDGGGHGPRNEFPPDATLSLSDHVYAEEDRR